MPSGENLKFYAPELYQKQCKELFEKYRVRVLELLPNARVEHIGASSIEGTISKGDLDIFVGVDAESLEEAVTILINLDFREKLGTLRTSELCMLESNVDNLAIQVVANNSEFEFFLKFRDKLRNSSSLVQQYNQLKMDCTGLPEAEYRERKSKFVEYVLEQA
jgi:GrpB-like predicted nucleotidyltransferase (UPF0157 family)